MPDAERVGFVGNVPVVMGADVKLIKRALLDSGNESFPDAGASSRVQRMSLRVPTIETADDTDFPGIWGPNAKRDAAFVSGVRQVRTELGVGAIIPPFVEEINVFGSKKAYIRARSDDFGFHYE